MRELCGDELLLRTRSSVVLNGGKQYRYPLELDDVLKQVSLARGARVIGSYAAERLRQLVAADPDSSFEDWVTHRFGRALYDSFFGPYTEKLWGIAPTQISADWASQRISTPSLSDVMLRLVHLRHGGARSYARRYLYPRLGIGQIFERMADEMVRDGGRLVLGASVTGLDVRANQVRAVRYKDESGEHELRCDAVISTVRLPFVARLLGRHAVGGGAVGRRAALSRDPPVQRSPRSPAGHAAHLDVRLRSALSHVAHPGAAAAQPVRRARRQDVADAGDPLHRR